MYPSFAGKLAVVTGGANGIGRACAMRFAAEGANVAILDHEEDPLNEVAREVRAAGGRVTPISCDLSDRPQVIEAFRKIHTDLGEVDILLNNVGQTARERASEFWCSEPEIWDFVIGLSLMTTLLCSRQVVPSMRERRSGKIVNIASDAALVGDKNVADYSAAKAGVIGFTRSLARELAPFKVNVNAVCPGPSKTRGPLKLHQGRMEGTLAAIPWGEMNEPEDVANGVAFFASDQARTITGQLLVINGGRIFN